MKIIPADFLDIDGYETAEAAIAAAQHHPLQTKARHDAASFNGRQFLDAWRDIDQWVLEFSGNLWLRIFIVGMDVRWTLQHTRPEGIALDEPIVFEWASGGRSRTNP